MATQQIRDPESGELIRFEWNKNTPPTPDDIDSLYKTVKTKGTAPERLDAYGEIKAPEPWYVQAIEPTAETIGLVGGGLIGGATGGILSVPSGPGVLAGMTAGGVAGAAGGYSLMKNTAQKVREFLGYDKPRGIGKTTSDVVKDVGVGGMMEFTGGLLGGTIGLAGTHIKQIMKGPFGQYLSSPAGKERMRIFEEFNIQPSPSDLMPDAKTLGIVESVLGYRPISGDVMLRRATEKVDALNKARLALIGKKAPDQTIEGLGLQIKKEAEAMLSKFSEGNQAKLAVMVDDFSTKMGLTGQHEAGARFATVMEGARGRAKGLVDDAYSAYQSKLPLSGDDVIPMENTMKTAQSLMKEETASAIPNKGTVSILSKLGGKKAEIPEGVTPEMIQKYPEIQAALEEVTNPNMTWMGLKKTRTQLLDRIREITRSVGGHTEESRVYSMLAESIDKDMESFAMKQGGDIWPVYQQARDLSRKYHEIYDKDILKIMNSNPEDIVKRIVKNGEVTLFRQIQQAGGEDALIPLRQSTFREMIESSTQNDIINTKKLAAKMKTLGEALDQLITPEQKNVLNEIIKSGQFMLNRGKDMKTVQFLETVMGTSNEGILNAVFKPNNIQNIRIAKKLLSQDRLDDITSFAIEKVLKMSGSGSYLPVTSAREAAKYLDPLKELLPPTRYKSLVDFISLGQNMTKVEALAKNASQTGQVLLGSQIASSVMRKPSIGMLTSTLGVPYIVARIYTSDAAIKYFTKAIRVSPYSGQAVANFTKALQIVGLNEMEQE